MLAAVANAVLDRRVPALGDRLAGEMHHGVAAGQRGDRSRTDLPIPGDRIDTQAPPRATGLTRQDRDLVTPRLQGV